MVASAPPPLPSQQQPPPSPDRVVMQPRGHGAVATLAVAGVGAAIAARVPVVGAVVGIATNTLLGHSPVRAMIGAVAVALLPALAIPICGVELALIADRVRKNGFVATASTILGLDGGAMLSSEARQ